MSTASEDSLDYVFSLEARRYEAVREALMKILPRQLPGFTETEARKALLPYLPKDLFPKRSEAGMWMRCVETDLEARGVLHHESTGKTGRWIRVK